MLTPAADLDNPLAMRHAGRDLLSLALIDARNRTLRLLAAFETAGRLTTPHGSTHLDGTPLWWIGHLGWNQETWIARNVQRQRGRRCDARGVRLASIEPKADVWWDPRMRLPVERHAHDLPGAAQVRQYLADTLEVTLELLMETAEHDQSLHFFREALYREDQIVERLIEAAQTLGVPVDERLTPVTGLARSPIAIGAGRTALGIPPEEGGYIFEAERGSRIDSFPDHDIDAQPVSWGQFLEFVHDGGYQNSRWWTPAGWEWVCQGRRRAPRMVIDGGDGLAQLRFGREVRIGAQQPVVHVNAFEAQAWCRWAGRRLPSEAEWVHAARQFAGRGWRWGDVWEWTADRLMPLQPDDDGCNLPASAAFRAACGLHRVLRGGSTATRARLRDPRHRHHRAPDDCHGLTGFRSCAL